MYIVHAHLFTTGGFIMITPYATEKLRAKLFRLTFGQALRQLVVLCVKTIQILLQGLN